jgi:hypothetical protein
MSPYDMAARSVFLMAQVVAYCSQEEKDRGEVDPRARVKRADALSRMLDEWEQRLPIDFNPLPLQARSTTTSGFKPVWVNPPVFGEFERMTTHWLAPRSRAD